ncbi:MAG: hypothetical protein LAN59_12295 [Acidobacteriia bacterium]|nr:hypothetical protein [Terriglobia bacterium]
MLTDSTPDPAPGKGIRNYVIASLVVLALALGYVGWVFWSRAAQNREIEERAALAFYASPGLVHRGEEVDLCYGVSNAKTVTLVPQPNAVWPSYSRCVQASPQKTTTYTLTVTDAAGNTKSASLTVEVR